MTIEGEFKKTSTLSFVIDERTDTNPDPGEHLNGIKVKLFSSIMHLMYENLFISF